MRCKFQLIMRRIFLVIIAFVALQAPAAAEPLVDAKQVEAWADQYYGRAITEKRSSGITISVVQDGKLIFSKGYGYADLGRGLQVNPETTGFQVGSITKTFIATAVGQLVDRGRIKSLDDPVNRYLKRVKLPGDRGNRVTIRQLLNHRAGFEENSAGYLTRPGQQVKIPLSAAEINRFMPAIALEPGGFVNYSNWGFSLLGFMIEDITGQRVDDYLRDNIWLPLGMTHTAMTYGYVPANAATPYQFEKDGTPVPSRVDLPHPWIGPAGGVISTAGDIARYMNAQMLEGENGGYPLVSKAMFRELHSEEYRNTPVSMGFALTFWVTELNGSPAIEHGGGTPNFQSMMVMIPGKRFGFFISAMNGGLVPWEKYSDEEIKSGKFPVHKATSGFEMRQSFVERFLKRTAEVKWSAVRQSPKLPLSAFPGTYWTQKRSYSTIEKLADAFNPSMVMQVTMSDDGRGLMLNGSGPYKEVANGIFASETASEVWKDPYAIDQSKPAYLAFNIDADGKVLGMVPNLNDQMWVPANPIFTGRGMLRVAQLCGLIALTGLFLFAWPQPARFRRPANLVALGAVIAFLAIPVAMMVGFAKDDGISIQIATGQFGRLWMITIAANLVALAGIALSILAIRTWLLPASDQPRSWAQTGYRIHLSIVAIAVLTLAVPFGFFNMLGLHIPG